MVGRGVEVWGRVRGFAVIQEQRSKQLPYREIERERESESAGRVKTKMEETFCFCTVV